MVITWKITHMWLPLNQHITMGVSYYLSVLISLILDVRGSPVGSIIINNHYWVSILLPLGFYCVMVLFPRVHLPKTLWLNVLGQKKDGKWRMVRGYTILLASRWFCKCLWHTNDKLLQTDPYLGAERTN
jgi:hypothetical protein